RRRNFDSCCSIVVAVCFVVKAKQIYLAFEKRTISLQKPGVCPKINLEDDMIGVCAELCSQDGHCPNDEKCCSNGCGHQCMAVSKGPGVCPKRFLGVGLCKGLCVNDIDCPKDEKCCSTKCGFKCTPPYKVRPGLCLKPNVC
uniref:WAP domain-containing protein n=1 Tax=Sinocyclocheilus grahami TaxID=75366 RepID=A0A672M6R3_SINGR